MKRRATGMTLVEVLMAIAFLSTILVSVVLLAKTAFDLNARMESNLLLEEQLRSALNRMTTLVEQATSSTAPTSGTSTAFTLTMSTTSTNPTTVSLASGTISVVQGTSTSARLTSQEINVTRFVVTRMNGTPAALRLEVDGRIRNASGLSQTSLSVTTTAFLRR